MSAGSRQAESRFQRLTGPGPAAIAIMRLWGPGVDGFLSRHVIGGDEAALGTLRRGDVRRGRLCDQTGEPIDDILVSVHDEGARPDVRLHLHGSPWIAGRCAELLAAGGFQEVPEAPVWAGADALDAECAAALPQMVTSAGVRWLLAQPARLRDAAAKLAAAVDLDAARALAEQIAGRRRVFEWFTRPLDVAVVGPPNAGKSALVNALTDRPVSLVADRPGTTRDWVTAGGEVGGYPVVWYDSAGLGDTDDALELAAAEQTRGVIARADALVVVFDVSEERAAAEAWRRTHLRSVREKPIVTVWNKCDLEGGPGDGSPGPGAEIHVSAIARTGLQNLDNTIVMAIGRTAAELAGPAAFADRHVTVLDRAARAGDRVEIGRWAAALMTRPVAAD